MFGLFRRAHTQPQIKERAPKAVVMQLGQAKWSDRNINAYTEEGYERNVVVFRCVDVISKALASIPLQVVSGEDVLERHPVLDLLRRPNPMQGKADFLAAVTAYRLITGNSYLECVTNARGVPLELWPWSPLQMRVVAGDDSWIPRGYVWSDGKREVAWRVDPVSNRCDLLHWKTFHPRSPWYGMSSLAAAAFSVDQHNSAAEWNQRLLQNCAVPSGVLQTSEVLTDPEFRTIEERIAEQTGPHNARRVMIFEGGLEWKQQSLSPADMDWLEGRKVNAMDIAAAFGVPTQLIPLDGAQTFANYEQARAAIYEDTVIPLLLDLCDELNRWLMPRYGNGLIIRPDVDDIPALEPRRAERWQAVQNADWLTLNEKREATGYPRIDDPAADEIMVDANRLPLGMSSIDPMSTGIMGDA